MKILCIIPARGGSKGVPGKNIKLLHGKPLLAYTAEIAQQSKCFDQIILSSDDDRIIEVARNLNIDVPFKRPDELSADDTPSIDVVVHALRWLESQKKFFDAVCLLQVTSPFRTVAFLDEAIAKFVAEDSDSLVSVQRVPHEFNPHWTFEINDAGNLRIATGEKQIIGRRQELPAAYHRDGNIYLTKTEVIQKQRSLYGENIAFIESPSQWYVNIDTMADWERAEQMAEKFC